ncbi:hypothetical protein QR98_0007300 [Sarcoptes scabiei]|uniref:Uncharacterized protein n=1 Tax=Sarcoptes scabiei TaxID=52283 RepID=A0A131ZW29_SARSC|nr:hypothetical protein QR98_0007300 [Sarcoptes scabiei]
MRLCLIRFNHTANQNNPFDSHSIAFNEKRYVLSDVYQGFYSLPIYLFSKLLYSMPQTILTGLAYALPACSMAGLQQHSNPNSLPFYLLLMLAHYMALRSIEIFQSLIDGYDSSHRYDGFTRR